MRALMCAHCCDGCTQIMMDCIGQGQFGVVYKVCTQPHAHTQQRAAF